MNVSLILTKDYREKDDFAVRINKPNSNPICQMGKIDAKSVFTEDYRKKDDFVVRINKPNFVKRPK